MSFKVYYDLDLPNLKIIMLLKSPIGYWDAKCHPDYFSQLVNNNNNNNNILHLFYMDWLGGRKLYWLKPELIEGPLVGIIKF